LNVVSLVLAVSICGCMYNPLLMLLVCWSCFSGYSYMVCIDLADLYWPNEQYKIHFWCWGTHSAD